MPYYWMQKAAQYWAFRRLGHKSSTRRVAQKAQSRLSHRNLPHDRSCQLQLPHSRQALRALCAPFVDERYLIFIGAECALGVVGD